MNMMIIIRRVYNDLKQIYKTKGIMKKISQFGRLILTIFLLAISAIVTMTQTNPKPGYVIKNNCDTIRGNIDFRTNEKLSIQWVFWANGGIRGRCSYYIL